MVAMSDLVEFLRGPVAYIALIAAGLGILAAEVWLLVTGTPIVLAVALLALTGATLFVLLHTLWEDYR